MRFLVVHSLLAGADHLPDIRDCPIIDQQLRDLAYPAVSHLLPHTGGGNNFPGNGEHTIRVPYLSGGDEPNNLGKSELEQNILLTRLR